MSAGRGPCERCQERVAAREGELTGHVVEPATADASRLRRAWGEDPQADGVRVHGEGAVASGPRWVGPLEPDVKLGHLAPQGEAHPASGRPGDPADPPEAAR